MTNFILRIKEQDTRLNLREHDDDVEDDEISIMATTGGPTIGSSSKNLFQKAAFEDYIFQMTLLSFQ